MIGERIHPGKSLENVHASVETTGKKGFFKSLLTFIGPAYLVSVGYMDPGNWATDIAAGSGFGYTLVWVLLMSNLIAILLQSLSARLGIVRGRDLAQASKESYPPLVNFILYLLAEVAIAATDLAEVLGLAIGLNLLFGLPLLAGVSVAVLDSVFLLLIINYGIRKMEAFIFSLVFIISASFFIEVFFANPDPVEVMKGFIPSLPNSTALYIAIGIIGATVMPHNLYLHSALVQTRRIDGSREGKRKAIRFNNIDSVIALNIAFLVNASILIMAGAVFFRNGYFNITEIQDAHGLLAPLLGTTLAPKLFAIALIASGQCSTITGTLSGQIVMEGYLNLRITPWLRRMITRLLAVIPAFLVIYFKGEESTGNLIILSQVILSIQLGFAVIPLIHFVSDKVKMGDLAIGPVTKTAAWMSAAIIVGLNGKLVLSLFDEWLAAAGNNSVWVLFTALPILAGAAFLLLYITAHPFITKGKVKSRGMHNENLPIDFTTAGTFHKIAVAVDFSDSDKKTISHALLLGSKNATYLLMHIVESAGARLMEREIADHETAEDMKTLQRYAASLKAAGYEVAVELGYGNPSKVLPRLVKAAGAEVLVMGAHGHRGLKDFIFGETINLVRHRISIPVLAVK